MRELWAKIGEKLLTFLLVALEKHPGKFIGVLTGFVLGLFIIFFGFWHTLLLIVLSSAGFIIGKNWDDNKRLWQWIERFFD